MNDVETYDEEGEDFRPWIQSDPVPSPERNFATPESRRTGNDDNDSDNDDGNENGYTDAQAIAEAAAAAAEVTLMEGPHNQRRHNGRDPTADRALMGATANDSEDLVAAHEATDESGELVRGAFEEFLQN